MDLYKEMLLRGVTPDAITYNTLLYAGAQAKLPGKVLVRGRTPVTILTPAAWQSSPGAVVLERSARLVPQMPQ